MGAPSVGEEEGDLVPPWADWVPQWAVDAHIDLVFGGPEILFRWLIWWDGPSAEERRERTELLLEYGATVPSCIRLCKQAQRLFKQGEPIRLEAPGSAADRACCDAQEDAVAKFQAKVEGLCALQDRFVARCLGSEDRTDIASLERSFFESINEECLAQGAETPICTAPTIENAEQIAEFRRLRRRETIDGVALNDAEDERLEFLWKANEKECDRIDAELDIASLERSFLASGNEECLAQGAVAPICTAPTTLAEQVQILKSQLGLEGGNMADIVRQATVQLGVEVDGRPLIEVAASCVQVLGAPLPVAVSVPVAVDDGVMAAEAEAEAAELQLLETQARCEFTSPCKRYAHTTPCQFRHATHMHMPCTCTCQYRAHAHAHAHEHARRRSPRRSRLRQRHALQGRRRPPPRRSLGEEEGEGGNHGGNRRKHGPKRVKPLRPQWLCADHSLAACCGSGR